MCVVPETNTVDADARAPLTRHHEITYPSAPGTAGHRSATAVRVTDTATGAPARVGTNGPELPTA